MLRPNAFPSNFPASLLNHAGAGLSAVGSAIPPPIVVEKERQPRSPFQKMMLKRNKRSETPREAVSTSPQEQAPVSASAITTYPLDELYAEFVAIACDATGQYVAAISVQHPASYLYRSSDYGQYFNTSSSNPWFSTATLSDVAIASNAPNYLAVTGYGGIYTSTNGGQSFTLISPQSNTWYNIVLSSTGQYAYVIYGGSSGSSSGQIYTSTDYMTSFSQLTAYPNNAYLDLATSADGQYLYVITLTSVMVSKDAGSTMQSTFSQQAIDSIACSSTGQYVAIAIENGFIYLSSNYGVNWNKANTGSNPYIGWTGIAMSGNGQYVVAVSPDYPVYTSSNYGQSFSASTSPALQYQSIVISENIGSNGQYYAYTVTNDYHLILTDNGGSTWSPLFYDWYGVTSSQNGQYRIAIVSTYYDSAVYLSSNNGLTWTSLTSPFTAIPYASWLSAACNADCQYIALTTFSNQIAISSNYGITWKAISLGNIHNAFAVNAISISSTGQYITAVTNAGPIYVSSNYGNSFSIPSTTVKAAYWATAMSSDGVIQLATSIGYSYFGDDDDQGMFSTFFLLR
jgi:photosystem II stability/assembly factor-like uncharacterized protein